MIDILNLVSISISIHYKLVKEIFLLDSMIKMYLKKKSWLIKYIFFVFKKIIKKINNHQKLV